MVSPLATYGQLPGPPKYTTDSVVHGASFAKGDFAPNTFISIFGENLAWSTRSVTAANLQANTLPTSLNGVQVLIGPTNGFLVFVSPGQINALIDSRLTPGTYQLRILRDSLAGPVATVRIAETAPGLFSVTDGVPVVTRPDGSLVTAQHPARPGQIVILWATGLGPTLPSMRPGELPRGAAPLDQKSPFQVNLNGSPVPAGHVLYAGVAPGFAGLYQINLLLPEDTPANPVIRVGYGNTLSPLNHTIYVAP
ncbi:MAG: hypothetical protein U5J83_06420 [Bryobacterales bacterium]|nr:hypothetical protein [Bryobacterales bacterium]